MNAIIDKWTTISPVKPGETSDGKKPNRTKRTTPAISHYKNQKNISTGRIVVPTKMAGKSAVAVLLQKSENCERLRLIFKKEYSSETTYKLMENQASPHLRYLSLPRHIASIFPVGTTELKVIEDGTLSGNCKFITLEKA